MINLTRRVFITTSATLAAGSAAAALTPTIAKKKHAMVHQVYFWLKNPDSKEDKAKLVEGIKKLAKIETVTMFHVGSVAQKAKKSNIDDSWSVSLMACFHDTAGEAAYQVHPLHLEFLKNHKELWSKVQVYDSLEV